MAQPSFAYYEPAILQGESGGDWNALYGYQNRSGGLFGDVKVSDMTINEVLDFQRTGSPYATYVTDILGYKSTPVGGYQIVGDTLQGAKRGMGLTGEEKFDPAMQRQVAQYIFDTQGPSAWEALKGTQMADQMTPPQMAQQQAAGYQPFSPENLSRSQRTMLGFAALRDAAAALRGNQTGHFGEALGGLQQEHKYGQELAFRQGQEQRLIDENRQQRELTAMAEVRRLMAERQKALDYGYSTDAIDAQIAAWQSSLGAMGSVFGQTAVAPQAVAGGLEPAAQPAAGGVEPAAQALNVTTASQRVYDPNTTDDQLNEAINFLSQRAATDDNVQGVLKAAVDERNRRGAAAKESGPDIENYRSAQTLITEISSNPALSGVLGRFEGGIQAGMYFSEKENALLAQIEQIRGKAFLDAFEKLKGGGPITDTEGKAATNAVTRIQNRFTDADEYKKALEELRQVFANAEARAIGEPVPYPNIGSAYTQNPAGVTPEAFEFFNAPPQGS